MSEHSLFEMKRSEKKSDPGEVEQAFKEQIEFLEERHVITAAHKGLKLLVLRAARAVDEIKPNDAASGQAQLLKALNEVATALPMPAVEEVSVIGALKELFGIDTDEAGPYDNPPEQ